jgi:hypothetical protein
MDYVMTEEERKVFLVADYGKAKWHEWFGLPPAKIYFSFDDLVKIGACKIEIPNILKSLLNKKIIETKTINQKVLYKFTKNFCDWALDSDPWYHKKMLSKLKST